MMFRIFFQNYHLTFWMTDKLVTRERFFKCPESRRERSLKMVLLKKDTVTFNYDGLRFLQIPEHCLKINSKIGTKKFFLTKS